MHDPHYYMRDMQATPIAPKPQYTENKKGPPNNVRRAFKTNQANCYSALALYTIPG